MGEKRIKLDAMRRYIANSLRESEKNNPTARSWNQIDSTNLLAFKEKMKSEGHKVSYGALLVKAIGVALQQHPDLNAYLDGEVMVVVDEINVGVAMQGPRGLYVPVVRNVQDKNVEEISADMRELARKAQNSELIPDDMAGGTVTLSSDGTGRTDFFASIITGNQALIIGVGRTKKEVVVLEDDTIAIRPMTWIAYNMNHVMTDGIKVSRFTDTLSEVLENPDKYLSF